MELIIEFLTSMGYVKIDDFSRGIMYQKKFLENEKDYFCLNISYPTDDKFYMFATYMNKETGEEFLIQIPPQYNTIIDHQNVLQTLIANSIWIKSYAEKFRQGIVE